MSSFTHCLAYLIAIYFRTEDKDFIGFIDNHHYSKIIPRAQNFVKSVKCIGPIVDVKVMSVTYTPVKETGSKSTLLYMSWR